MSEIHEDERECRARWATHVAGDFFELLATMMPEHSTLGEMRILNRIAHAQLNRAHVCVTELVDQVGLPRSTVSRYVKRFLEEGRIVDIGHPEDSRRRSLRYPPAVTEVFMQWGMQMHAIRTRNQPLLEGEEGQAGEAAPTSAPGGA